MKKVICLLLPVFLLLTTGGISESTDYSTMSISELTTLLIIIQTELEVRTALEQEDLVLINDPEGVTIYLNNKEIKKGNYIDDYEIGISVVNNLDREIQCGCKIYINGWDAGYDDFIYGANNALAPLRKAQKRVTIALSRSNIVKPYALDDVVTLELAFYIGSQINKEKAYDAVTLIYNGTEFRLATKQSIISQIK